MAQKTGRNIARRYLIAGRVQGVGYRAFAQHAARELGLTGWARNLGGGGGVEVHANGTAVQLDTFEGRLRQGPRWSEVRSVEVTDAAVSGAHEFAVH